MTVGRGRGVTRLWLLSGCDQCWRLSITCGSDLDWKEGGGGGSEK